MQRLTMYNSVPDEEEEEAEEEKGERWEGKSGRNERGREVTLIFPRAGFWNLFERFEI